MAKRRTNEDMTIPPIAGGFEDTRKALLHTPPPTEASRETEGEEETAKKR